MANEIINLINSIPKLKNDFKVDWKEDTKTINHKQDYGSDLASAPVNTVAPAITGTATVGSTLTCSNGTWTGAGITFTFQWNRSGDKKTLGTASTYVLTSAEQTKTITCTVIATNTAGRTLKASNTTAAIA